MISNNKTVSEWYINGLIDFLSPLYNVVPYNLQVDEKKLFNSQAQLHDFFNYMYVDMKKHTDRYKVPQDLLELQAFSKNRLKVRKIITNCILDLLYKLGQVAVLDKGMFILSQQEWQALIQAKSKKLKSADILINILNQLGFVINGEQNKVCISHLKYPQMFLAYSVFAKHCALNKKLGLKCFYLLDFRFFNNHKLTLDDAVKSLPLEVKVSVIEADSYLAGLKYRRKIEFYEDFGYRIIYSNKAGVVLYMHINSYKASKYFHYLRWVLNTAQSEMLFNELLQNNRKDIADYLLKNIVECDPNCVPGYGATSPDQCKARIYIFKHDIYVCKDKGCLIGIDTIEFEYLTEIMSVIQAIIYKK